MNNKKDIKLYNVLFPVWMIMMMPIVWIIVLPGNFIIDSLVLFVSMFILRIKEKKQFYKKFILKIFAFGFLADAIGSAYMFILMVEFSVGDYGDEPYLTVPALIIAAVLIFIFNYFITFKKVDKKEKIILSLIFAVVTAPYTFLIPSKWIY